ncbi:hypothetical protein WR25_25837 [Diploscapter pachys]|uniref:Tectonic-1-3 domain-containing protein n=1 Tax=Diploscapter pachys TaxID=2018661 RepID=A0A2A2JLY1_9BILA|nr:hypothetical protein WR25_25837 [Diploscapter pachys]
MEQWDRFEAVNKVQIQRSQGLNQLPVRTATSQGSIAWQILGPSSIGGSNCGISHSIVFGNNASVECQPFTGGTFDRQACEQSLNGVLLEGQQFSIDDQSFASLSGSLRRPTWNNDTCQNALQRATILFSYEPGENSTSIASISSINLKKVIYKNLRRIDVMNFKRQIKVQFSTEDIPELSPSTTNMTSEFQPGYEAGDLIMVNENVSVSVPSLGSCVDGPQIDAQFMTPMKSICTIRAPTCNAAQSRIREFLQRLPKDISSLPYDYDRMITVLNGTTELTVSSPNRCSVPQISLDILSARQGTTDSYKVQIVAALLNIAYFEVSFKANQDLFISVNVSFNDITSAPTSVFAELPHIDLRLPADFFYPFVSSNTSKPNKWLTITFIVLFFL